MGQVDPDRSRMAAAERAVQPERQAARGLVLIVEDDAIVRQASAETLRDAGFAVEEAEDAADALRILERNSDVHAMITDVHMPGEINGYFLARRVRERWPHIEILLVTGYAAPHRRDLELDCSVVVKPFEGQDLVRHVEALVRRVV